MRYYAKRCEDSEQAVVIRWAEMRKHQYPALRWLHHIPNGGKRDSREAARLKAQGVKAGVLDLFLPAAMGGFHGLYIEMKYGENKLTEHQKEFIRDVSENGYCCKVAYGAGEAIKILDDYLNGELTIEEQEGEDDTEQDD